MALAEVFEAIVGPEAPVEFTAYDGEGRLLGLYEKCVRGR